MLGISPALWVVTKDAGLSSDDEWVSPFVVGMGVVMAALLSVALIVAAMSSDACGINCRHEKREAEVRRIKAENIGNGKACYTHLDTMVPCPKEKP